MVPLPLAMLLNCDAYKNRQAVNTILSRVQVFMLHEE